MDENETVKAFANDLAGRAEGSEIQVMGSVHQDVRSGGYFFEVMTPEAAFRVLVTAMDEDDEEGQG